MARNAQWGRENRKRAVILSVSKDDSQQRHGSTSTPWKNVGVRVVCGRLHHTTNILMNEQEHEKELKRTRQAPARGKRYDAARQKVDRDREYGLDEAIQLVKDTAGVKFDASVEVHGHLGIDPKKAEQIVRTSIVLPHSTGKKRRIAVFTTPGREQEAKDAGADVVGGEELVKQIQQTSKCDFDVAVATPDFMRNMATIARTLGQKGLMPNPKNETVTTNLAKTIGELKTGKLAVRSDESGNVHGLVGKVSMPNDALKANIEAFVAAIKRAKPAESKGTYLKSVTLASAMGPGIRVRV